MFELIITPDAAPDDRLEITAGMRDVRMWEKTNRGRALASHLGDNMKAEYVFELAYAACRRQKLPPAEVTFEEFLERYEIELEDPAERRARHRAEALKDQIDAAGADDEDEESQLGVDPTRAGASPAQ